MACRATFVHTVATGSSIRFIVIGHLNAFGASAYLDGGGTRRKPLPDARNGGTKRSAMVRGCQCVASGVSFCALWVEVLDFSRGDWAVLVDRLGAQA